MKFFNLSEEQTIDLSELDFVNEMLDGDVWNCIEEDSQKLTEFFTMANKLAKAKTDFLEYLEIIFSSLSNSTKVLYLVSQAK